MTDAYARVLDAATRVLLRDGAQALTLEAVAKEAEVSKGGLLYHFANKQALVAGMVARLVSQFDAAIRDAGDGPGAASRAYLVATVAATPTAASVAADRTAAALLAAALVEPDALIPLRGAYRRWQRRLEHDGIDPARATAVRLAVDGWWLARLLDLAPPPPRLHKQVYGLVVDLIEGAR
jgi:AcrR family transcriptional regulator